MLQIREYNSLVSKCYGEVFDGRWSLALIKDNNDNQFLEWTDLFGHQEPRKLKCSTSIIKFHQLDENLGLFIELTGEDHLRARYRLGRLDHKKEEITLGEKHFEIAGTSKTPVVIDRASPLPNGDRFVLFFQTKIDTAHYCRLDVKNLEIEVVGGPFPLAHEDFNSTDLNGDIISGLSKVVTNGKMSFPEIKRYNVRRREFEYSTAVEGLPETTRCLWEGYLGAGGIEPARSGLWTEDYFYVWTERMQDDQNWIFDNDTTLFRVHLATGIAEPTNFSFAGMIRKIFQRADRRHLYFDTYLYAPLSSEMRPLGGRRILDFAFQVRYIRVPLNQPESLFFLASLALPRPLSDLSLHILKNAQEIVPLHSRPGNPFAATND